MIRMMLALMVCGCFMLACSSVGECEKAGTCKCAGSCKDAGQCEKSEACAKAAPETDATHVITDETNFYVSGPQQARPPEGKFAAGTRVTLISDAGSYSQVRALDGREGYVSTDALKALD